MSAAVRPALIKLHIAVLLWGFTAVLGKLISYGSLNLVWHRMLLTAAVYLFVPGALRGIAAMTNKERLRFAGIGCIIAIHWLTFYGSIKIGDSVSLALGCFGSVSLFTALLDPLVARRPIHKGELILGLLVLGGLVLIYFSRPDDAAAETVFLQAAGVGIFSAFLAALFSVLNKKYLPGHGTLSVSTVELGAGFLFLSLALPFVSTADFHWIPEGWDILWLLLLAIVCTNLAFFLGTDALHHVSAFTANLAVNLEPVYGIVFAAFFFKEYTSLNPLFYAGAAVIIASVLIQPALMRHVNRKPSDP